MTVALHPTDILNAQFRFDGQSICGVEDTNLPGAHAVPVRQTRGGVGDLNLPQPNLNATASLSPAAAPNLPDAHPAVECQGSNGVGDQTTETVHRSVESQTGTGGLGSNPPAPPISASNSHWRRGGAGGSGDVR